MKTVCAAKSSSGDNSVSIGEGARGAAVTRAPGVCMGVPCWQGPGSVHGCALLAGTLAEGASSLQGTGASDAVMPLLGTDPKEVIKDSQRGILTHKNGCSSVAVKRERSRRQQGPAEPSTRVQYYPAEQTPVFRD